MQVGEYIFIHIIKGALDVSDVPLVKAKDVEYYPGAEDIKLITEWAEYTIAKAITDYFPAFKNCKKYIRLGIFRLNSYIIKMRHISSRKLKH